MNVITEFEEEFKKFTGAKHAIACSSGTAALHTALTAVGIGRGDKVITSPFSFVASANVILHCGATPVFADIYPDTYCIDPHKVQEILETESNIKVILCVHLFGNVCDMPPLINLSKEYGLSLIEDCAQALGRNVGRYGDFGCYSFYKSKNLWTFEGGMLITEDDKLAEKARMIINHGRKLDTKHEHVMLGYNYRIAEPLALIGLTMLKRHKKAILSELGSYGIEDGFYPYVIYDLPLYKDLGIKGNCPNAEKAVEEARKYVNQK